MQDYENFELILVDDGSTDGSTDICRQYAAKSDKINFFRQIKGGVSAARNIGMAHASGEYIFFIDSDDWLEEHAISSAIESLLLNNSQMVFFKFYFRDENGRIVSDSGNIQKFPSQQVTVPQEVLPFIIEDKLPSYPWSFVCKRSVYLSNNIYFPLGRLLEDVGTTYRLVGNSTIISFVDKPLYNYRLRKGSILSSKHSILAFDDLKNYAEMSRFVDKYFPDLRVCVRNAAIWNIALDTRRVLKYLFLKEITWKKYRIFCNLFREKSFELKNNLRSDELSSRSIFVLLLFRIKMFLLLSTYTYIVQVISKNRRPSNF
jgi:glycosyltransferase involved in cell wall biosynthesis